MTNTQSLGQWTFEKCETLKILFIMYYGKNLIRKGGWKYVFFTPKKYLNALQKGKGQSEKYILWQKERFADEVESFRKMYKLLKSIAGKTEH